MTSKKLSSPLPACYDSSVIEAGCDEAGRGCLAGPVYAAAVILPPAFSHPWLNDSKQITERRREELRRVIESEAVCWAIGVVDNNEIDRINILNASILAMHRALDGLKIRPQAVIVDGNRFKPYGNLPWTTFVKGDGRFANIAAASILAKTHRDSEMRRLHSLHSLYGWDINKGYPTRAHRQAIEKYGVTPYHRMSFRLLDSQPTLFPDIK